MSVHYNVVGQPAETCTPMMRGLNVLFNHTTRFDFKKVTPEVLEWLESGCLTLRVFAAQEEADDPAMAAMARANGPRRKDSMTSESGGAVPAAGFRREVTLTADETIKRMLGPSTSIPEERDEDGVLTAPAAAQQAATAQLAAANEELRAQLQQLRSQLEQTRGSQMSLRRVSDVAVPMSPDQRMESRITQLERDLSQSATKYQNRERRLHQLLEAWAAKPEPEQTFAGLMAAMRTYVTAPDKFRRVANVVGAAKLAYAAVHHTDNNSVFGSPAMSPAMSPEPAEPAEPAVGPPSTLAPTNAAPANNQSASAKPTPPAATAPVTSAAPPAPASSATPTAPPKTPTSSASAPAAATQARDPKHRPASTPEPPKSKACIVM